MGLFDFWKKKDKKEAPAEMTEDEKQIAKAKEDIAEKGADSQTEKDRVDESVAAQERADGNKDTQSAKDRVDESEDAKKTDEQRAEDKAEAKTDGTAAKLDAMIERMDKLISIWEQQAAAKAEAHEDRLAAASTKYGMAPAGAGEAARKSFTDEDVKKLLG